MEVGKIRWSKFNDFHERDCKLDGNLKKAPQINYQTLHPGNKNQNVLALNIFREETTAALKSYFPEEKQSAKFLRIFYMWWVMTNAKQEINTNNLNGNAAVKGDGKPEYFRHVANWLKNWQESQISNFQKFTLIEDLLEDDFKFVLTARLQCDPIKRRFSAYRQMSGSRFLVSLRAM